MSFASGSRLGPYEIVSPLGAGGMGEVYRATDTRLKRAVALKVLRPGLAESLGRDRFLREIRLAARLNHPHILRSTIPARPAASCSSSCR